MQNVINSKNRVRLLCISAVLIAISILLANIKIFQSIAFDSMPAFLAGMIISPLIGGIIGAIGHFFTALFSGFPYSLPMHLVIMIEMFIVVYATGYIYRKGYGILAVIIGIVLNGPISVVISGIAYEALGAMSTMQFVAMMIVPLTIAAIANVTLAFILGKVLKNANIKI